MTCFSGLEYSFCTRRHYPRAGYQFLSGILQCVLAGLLSYLTIFAGSAVPLAGIISREMACTRLFAPTELTSINSDVISGHQKTWQYLFRSLRNVRCYRVNCKDNFAKCYSHSRNCVFRNLHLVKALLCLFCPRLQTFSI